MTNTNNPAVTKLSTSSALPKVFIGLPQWQHSHWPKTWFASYPKSDNQLVHYAKECNTVEGNTTFYSLPHADAVARWEQSVGSDFSFTFKFNQQITHVHQLLHCEDEVNEQLNILAPLGQKLGVMLLQLPASFGPEKLERLTTFLSFLPPHITVAVEVRHLAFFAKGNEEKQLNQLLIEHKANRIIMDTRALFTGPVSREDTSSSDSALLREVRNKKPRVPVNVIATATNPIVRFVGNDNDEDNIACLTPWVNKVHQWRLEGKSPYFFCHRPDNKDAPWLAQQFIDLYNQKFHEVAIPNLALKQQPNQNTLF
ncbi:DUF72 domain-containing protein [Alteromonas sp. CI.11.F.A3]|uniref:DUF72 domain-containing protein n=1 Tax=Alteromonas sp. CI.11.F.A3 TaxID=3079555 RepID=UPI002942E0BA|nr:DUF72 domain-containing protein [Alteromonas sp. CI.11.F.A3]WOI36408.1 DUF72 domain-containing protein [Alteromonas sp. CI.11.F.A3]